MTGGSPSGARPGHAGRRTRAFAPAARRSPDADLSPREVDVVRLVAQGLTNAEISHTLSITVGTVKTHLGNIQGKLAVRNRVEIAAWAWRVGLARAD
ncbi:response regulator transcription factor [Streptomyces hirsutus]|uniref:response regulator transcription factor n=1 Tax=Streptomyces hirsutus TaxID=35620 RepID=UPI003D9F00EC